MDNGNRNNVDPRTLFKRIPLAAKHGKPKARHSSTKSPTAAAQQSRAASVGEAVAAAKPPLSITCVNESAAAAAAATQKSHSDRDLEDVEMDNMPLSLRQLGLAGSKGAQVVRNGSTTAAVNNAAFDLSLAGNSLIPGPAAGVMVEGHQSGSSTTKQPSVPTSSKPVSAAAAAAMQVTVPSGTKLALLPAAAAIAMQSTAAAAGSRQGRKRLSSGDDVPAAKKAWPTLLDVATAKRSSLRMPNPTLSKRSLLQRRASLQQDIDDYEDLNDDIPVKQLKPAQRLSLPGSGILAASAAFAAARPLSLPAAAPAGSRAQLEGFKNAGVPAAQLCSPLLSQDQLAALPLQATDVISAPASFEKGIEVGSVVSASQQHALPLSGQGPPGSPLHPTAAASSLWSTRGDAGVGSGALAAQLCLPLLSQDQLAALPLQATDVISAPASIEKGIEADSVLPATEQRSFPPPGQHSSALPSRPAAGISSLGSTGDGAAVEVTRSPEATEGAVAGVLSLTPAEQGLPAGLPSREILVAAATQVCHMLSSMPPVDRQAFMDCLTRWKNAPSTGTEPVASTAGTYPPLPPSPPLPGLDDGHTPDVDDFFPPLPALELSFQPPLPPLSPNSEGPPLLFPSLPIFSSFSSSPQTWSCAGLTGQGFEGGKAVVDLGTDGSGAAGEEEEDMEIVTDDFDYREGLPVNWTRSTAAFEPQLQLASANEQQREQKQLEDTKQSRRQKWQQQYKQMQGLQDQGQQAAPPHQQQHPQSSQQDAAPTPPQQNQQPPGDDRAASQDLSVGLTVSYVSPPHAQHPVEAGLDGAPSTGSVTNTAADITPPPLPPSSPLQGLENGPSSDPQPFIPPLPSIESPFQSPLPPSRFESLPLPASSWPVSSLPILTSIVPPSTPDSQVPTDHSAIPGLPQGIVPQLQELEQQRQEQQEEQLAAQVQQQPHQKQSFVFQPSMPIPAAAAPPFHNAYPAWPSSRILDQVEYSFFNVLKEQRTEVIPLLVRRCKLACLAQPEKHQIHTLVSGLREDLPLLCDRIQQPLPTQLQGLRVLNALPRRKVAGDDSGMHSAEIYMPGIDWCVRNLDWKMVNGAIKDVKGVDVVLCSDMNHPLSLSGMDKVILKHLLLQPLLFRDPCNLLMSAGVPAHLIPDTLNATDQQSYFNPGVCVVCDSTLLKYGGLEDMQRLFALMEQGRDKYHGSGGEWTIKMREADYLASLPLLDEQRYYFAASNWQRSLLKVEDRDLSRPSSCVLPLVVYDTLRAVFTRCKSRFHIAVLPTPEDIPEGMVREGCSAALEMGANQIKDAMVATLPDLLEFLALLIGDNDAAALSLEQVDDVRGVDV